MWLSIWWAGLLKVRNLGPEDMFVTGHNLRVGIRPTLIRLHCIAIGTVFLSEADDWHPGCLTWGVGMGIWDPISNPVGSSRFGV